MAVAMTRTRVVVATASACATSPLASPREPMVWNRAMTAVVPMTTSPERREEDDQSDPAHRIADNREDHAQRDDEDEEMPEPHGNLVLPLTFSIFEDRSLTRRRPTILWIMTRFGACCQRLRAVVASEGKW